MQYLQKNNQLMFPLRLFTLLFCFQVGQLTAQQGFVYEDSTTDTTEYVSSVVELRTGGYVAALRKITAEGRHCQMVKLDENGALLQTAVLGQNSHLLINAVAETTAGILLFGTAGDYLTGDFVSILLDQNLAVIAQYSVPLGNFQESGVFVTPLDSFLLISGTVLENSHFRSFLLKVASNGEIINFNPLFVNDLISNGLYRKSDQRFLFFGYQEKIYEADADLQIDTIVGQTPYGLWMEGGMAWANDSTLLLVGKRKNNIFQPPYEDTQNIGIGVLDQHWHKKNLYQIGMPKDTIDFPAFNTPISVASSGDIFVGGNAHYQVGYWLYRHKPSWQVLAKLHPDNFSPQWVKYYGGDAYYSMFGVLATSDGGCLMYGAKYTKQGEADADGYIMKVAGDGTTSNDEPKKDDPWKVQVFPNPVSSQLSIRSDQQPFRFELFDVAGKMVKSLESTSELLEVEVNDLPAAAYFYKITAAGVVTGLLLKQ